MLNLHHFLPAVWIVREAVVPIANTVAVMIAVLLVQWAARAVAQYFRNKGQDYARWIGSMQKM